jgi:hypothetical protein
MRKDVKIEAEVNQHWSPAARRWWDVLWNGPRLVFTALIWLLVAGIGVFILVAVFFGSQGN